MAHSTREPDALPLPQTAVCPSTENCPLPHANCAPAAGVPAVPTENPFSLGVTVAITVCASILGSAALLILGAAVVARSILGWFGALRPKRRRGD